MVETFGIEASERDFVGKAELVEQTVNGLALAEGENPPAPAPSKR